MYRKGLSRAQIANLTDAAPATVGYHLGLARTRTPAYRASMRPRPGTPPGPPPTRQNACSSSPRLYRKPAGTRPEAQTTSRNGRWRNGFSGVAAKPLTGRLRRRCMKDWACCRGGGAFRVRWPVRRGGRPG